MSVRLSPFAVYATRSRSRRLASGHRRIEAILPCALADWLQEQAQSEGVPLSQYLALLIQAMQATHGDLAALASWSDLAREQMRAKAEEATAKKAAARAHISDNHRATAEAWASAAREQAQRWDAEKRAAAETRLPYIDNGLLKGYWVDLKPSVDGTKAILTLADRGGRVVSAACHPDLLRSGDVPKDLHSGQCVMVAIRWWSSDMSVQFSAVWESGSADADLAAKIEACSVKLANNQ